MLTTSHIFRTVLPLAAALLLTWTQPGWGQSKEIIEAFKQYKEHERQGKYAEAIRYAKSYVELAEREFGTAHQHYAMGLNNLAGLFYAQGRYAEAKLLYERALEIGEKALGSKHLFVATTLNNLGGIHRSQGRYEKAEPLLTRALAIYENALGTEHPSVATSLSN